MIVIKDNLNRLRSRYNPRITEISWRAGDLDPQALLNLPNLVSFDCSNNKISSFKELIECCPQLQELNCSFNCIGSLKRIGGLKHLQKLNCSDNWLKQKIVIKDMPNLVEINLSSSSAEVITIDNCPKLKIIRCQYSYLRKIPRIRNCPSVTELYLEHNYIKSLNRLASCPQLVELNVEANNITNIQGIEHCTLLQTFDCCSNEITCINKIKYCSPLHTLRCSRNKIRSIEGIEHCTQLRRLYVWSNNIESLEPVVYLQHLIQFYYDNNELDVQSLQVQRFVERLRYGSIKSSIYDNKQNVHDINIQDTVCQSIKRLLRDPKPDFTLDAVINSGLPEHTVRLLVEYCEDTCVHSVHLLRYVELLAYVWARIDKSPHKDQLLIILAEQITDAECKCFTGRFIRTLSVLAGFDDDITIEIADSSRISAIILTIRDRIEPYDLYTHVEQAKKALVDAGYAEAEIEPWLGAISEP